MPDVVYSLEKTNTASEIGSEAIDLAINSLLIRKVKSSLHLCEKDNYIYYGFAQSLGYYPILYCIKDINLIIVDA